MNKPVYITYDSTCDLSKELLDRFQIKTIPLSIFEGETQYLDGVNFEPDQIYEQYQKNGVLPKTAAVSPGSFVDFWTPLVQEGYEIVHFDISMELSSTYQNACIAAQELSGVHVIDTRQLSTGGALLALEAAALRDAGKSAAEIVAEVSTMVEDVDASFVLDTLEYIWKGGRCSAIAVLGVNLLQLKPCLEMHDGMLSVGKKYRGLIEKVCPKYIQDRLAGKTVRPNYAFVTHSGGVPEDVLEQLRQLVEKTGLFHEVFLTRAGCTVTSHCGPKTMGIFFLHAKSNN